VEKETSKPVFICNSKYAWVKPLYVVCLCVFILLGLTALCIWLVLETDENNTIAIICLCVGWVVIGVPLVLCFIIEKPHRLKFLIGEHELTIWRMSSKETISYSQVISVDTKQSRFQQKRNLGTLVLVAKFIDDDFGDDEDGTYESKRSLENIENFEEVSNFIKNNITNEKPTR